MRKLIQGLLLCIFSFSAAAQFPSLSLNEELDPFGSMKVYRVDSMAALEERLGKLSEDVHLIIDSGEFELPEKLVFQNYALGRLKIKISPSASGAVRLKGRCLMNLGQDVVVEFSRLRFDGGEVLKIRGGKGLKVDACHFDGTSLEWDLGVRFELQNSVFIHGANLKLNGFHESSARLMHNTWNIRKGPALAVLGSGLSLRLDNNIVQGKAEAALASKDASSVMLEGRNNLFFGWQVIGLDGKERLLKSRQIDPLLEGKGFRLREGSPAINAAAALGESVSGDIDGDYRGLRPDIGADEF